MQACTQSEEPVRDCCNRLQIIFKENSGLPLDVDPTQVVFNCLFINRLNYDRFLLVKRIRMEWETTSTPDLIWQANSLAF